MNPTDSQALQFALMLQAGLPAAEAILYFTEETDPAQLAATLQRWLRSKAVRQAQRELLGKSWQEMSVDEQCRVALDRHYSQLAYVLYSTNYTEAGSQEKAKLDTARQAIEAKLAGMAGKSDGLAAFLEDLRSGKIRPLSPTIITAAKPAVN